MARAWVLVFKLKIGGGKDAAHFKSLDCFVTSLIHTIQGVHPLGTYSVPFCSIQNGVALAHPKGARCATQFVPDKLIGLTFARMTEAHPSNPPHPPIPALGNRLTRQGEPLHLQIG